MGLCGQGPIATIVIYQVTYGAAGGLGELDGKVAIYVMLCCMLSLSDCRCLIGLVWSMRLH